MTSIAALRDELAVICTMLPHAAAEKWRAAFDAVEQQVTAGLRSSSDRHAVIDMIARAGDDGSEGISSRLTQVDSAITQAGQHW
jgi:hypothetical protein